LLPGTVMVITERPY